MRVHSQDLKSLIQFLQDYPSAQAVLLYRGAEMLMQDNICIMPCEKFLKDLNPSQLFLGDKK